MSLVRRLLSGLESVERRALEARLEDLEVRITQLYDENISLNKELEELRTPEKTRVLEMQKSRDDLLVRVENLRSALGKMIRLREKDWSGADEQAVIRSAQAIWEDV